jgi:predicted transcriptional regulator
MATATESTLVLTASTAKDLMTANPISIREDANLREALLLFTEKGFSAAPVIDDAGRPVGVLSQSDIVVHDRETVNCVPPVPEYFNRTNLRTSDGERLSGFQVERVDQTRVRDMMTPAVFSVGEETSSSHVIKQLLALNVHRLFVVDSNQTLVGVISTLDILRSLRNSE